MTDIEKLPENIVAQIAAGEVVERPANIIKELVENSLDAGADKIIIQIEDGGLKEVHIQDNGSGIPEHEIELAFELHTTSKMKKRDLSVVDTLGFRGEALASISSISHIHCKSKTDNSSGKQIYLEGGKLISQSSISMSTGTSIRISAIFYNTPARRKFLKTASTERKHVMRLITHYSLLYPEVHFILEEKDNKGNFSRKQESPSRKSALAAIFDVLGHDIAGELVPIDGQAGNWKISGFISEPNLIRKDRNHQYISINGRPIQHPELQGFIEKAYGSQLMKSSHPIIIIDINGPVSEVDFNIHPRKSEVRFRTDDKIFEEIYTLVEQALDKTWKLPELRTDKLDRIKISTESPVKPKKAYFQTTFDRSKKDLGAVKSTKLTVTDILDKEKDERKEDKPDKLEIFETLLSQSDVIVDGKKILGHIMKKFAVVDAGSELWLVDMHAADERVKFEMYQQRRTRKILSQLLITPMIVNLSTIEKQVIVDNLSSFSDFGMTISEGTGNTVLIHSLPVLFDRELNKDSAKDLLLVITSAIGEEGEGIRSETPFTDIEYKIVANLACHGSIRSGYHVSNEVIGKVLSDLFKCKNPWTCAHGRPSILRIDKTKLEGWFKR